MMFKKKLELTLTRKIKSLFFKKRENAIFYLILYYDWLNFGFL